LRKRHGVKFVGWRGVSEINDTRTRPARIDIRRA
jgi:hypothetical protein